MIAMDRSRGLESRANDNFKALLGANFNPNWSYQLVFPSSLPYKVRLGWSLVMENADEILGQPLVVVGKEN